MHQLPTDRPSAARIFAGSLLAVVMLAGAASDRDPWVRQADLMVRRSLAWYRRTPPEGQVVWGALAAGAVAGLGGLAAGTLSLRRRRVLPPVFTGRFLDRLRDGKLDRGKGVDFCELNPSPAARVVLAAVRRWGRPAADGERAVALALHVEAARLRRRAGSSGSIAKLAPMLGLLGTLLASGRALSRGPMPSGPALAEALGPLTAGIALAILARVVHDQHAGRAARLVDDLGRLGLETVDAIAMTEPVLAPPSSRPHPSGPARTPHQIRVDVPDAIARPREPEADL